MVSAQSAHDTRGDGAAGCNPGLQLLRGCPGSPAGKRCRGAKDRRQLCPPDGLGNPSRHGRADLGGTGGRRTRRSRAPPPQEPPPTALPDTRGRPEPLARGAVFAGRTRRRGRRPSHTGPLLPRCPLPSSGRPGRGAGVPVVSTAPRPPDAPWYSETEVILEATAARAVQTHGR